MAATYGYDETDEAEYQRGAIAVVKDAVLSPIRILLSRKAQLAYFRTFIIFSISLTLLGFSILAYLVFYYSYIPRISLSRPIYLQFGDPDHPHPYGSADISGHLVSNQAYDVRVLLHLPRTPENVAAGNFMLDLTLYAPSPKGTLIPHTERDLIERTQRAAMLTYYSPLVEHLHKAKELPWYFLGWRKESETLNIALMEGVEFSRGWRYIPSTARLVLRSESRMQVYDVRIEFHARFHGLRYLMYNYRVISLVVFTSMFWTISMGTTIVAWLLLSFLVSEESPRSKTIRQERDGNLIKQETPEDASVADLSDTSRTFPTYSGQPTLRYASPAIKQEEQEEAASFMQATPYTQAEADDEDEDADFVLDSSIALGGRSDSGLGTSLDSASGRRSPVRRRKDRLSHGGGRI